MITFPDLFSHIEPEVKRKPTHRDKFEAFHAANPHVYKQLIRRARQLKEKGLDGYGINSLIEIVRWHTIMTTDDEDFKINNNHAPFYSRLIMESEEDLSEFFKIREQRSADKEAKDGNTININ